MEEKDLLKDFWARTHMGAIVHDPFRVQSEYKPNESIKYFGGACSNKSKGRKISSRSSALNAAMFNSIF